MRKLLTTVGGVLLAFCLESAAQAYTYAEIGDAGELVSSAQAVILSAVQGTGPSLDTITGSLTTTNQISSNGAPIPFVDTDLFAISLTAGTTFTAQVTSLFDAPYGEEPAFAVGLYLFDSTGRGLGYNQSGTNFNIEVQTTGDYYFGITDAITRNPLSDPNDPASQLFADPTAPSETMPAQTDAPLAGWSSGQTEIEYMASYSVALTGASVSTIPEPSIGGGLLALGGLSLAALGRKKSTQKVAK